MLGMTEAGSVCLVDEDESDQPEHRRGSFGRPAPGLESRIVDPDTGVVSGVDEIGELWLRGPFMMEGYYGRERSETFTPDGWFRTGDLVRVDADGLHYFKGRHGDMIKTAGANVSPREVEAAIADVSGLQAHVLGVDSADRGQIVAAALVLPDGDDMTAAELDELRRRLAARAVRVQGAQDPAADAEVRRADDVERQARRPRPARSGWRMPERGDDPGPDRRTGAAPGNEAGHRQRRRGPDLRRSARPAAREVARRLVAGGVGKRTRVGLLMPNGIEWAVTAYAAMRIGAVLVPLSTLLRPPELEAQLATATVAVLIAEPEYRGRRYLDELDEHLGDITSVGTTRLRHERLPNLRAVWPTDDLPDDDALDAIVDALAARVRPADDLAVMFTSGSRGRPKGVIHTHGGAIRATAAGLDARCLGEDDRLYIPMPFFWMGGFGSGLLSTLIAGATLLTETDPVTRDHDRASSSASRRPCSGAGRTRRPGSRPTRPSPRPTCTC